MDIVPRGKKLWFQPTFEVIYQNRQEVEDVVNHGGILPFPTITGLRTLGIARSARSKFPAVVHYSEIEAGRIADELSRATTLPEIATDIELFMRLDSMSSIMLNVMEDSTRTTS